MQGYLEVTKAGAEDGAPIVLNAKHVACIEKHLALAFVHDIDPSMGPPEHQVNLDAAHEGRPPRPPKPQSHLSPFVGGDSRPGALMRC